MIAEIRKKRATEGGESKSPANVLLCNQRMKKKEGEHDVGNNKSDADSKSKTINR